MKKAVILLGIFTHSILTFSQENTDIVKKGDKIPDFELSSSLYRDIDSKDLKGKIVLINIFATWCGPCQLELSEIEKDLWPKYKDNKDFVMLVVGREHTDEELEIYNKKKGFSFPLYPDPKRGFTSKFAKQSIPRTYIVDKNGLIIYNSKGYGKEQFKELMMILDEKLAKK